MLTPNTKVKKTTIIMIIHLSKIILAHYKIPFIVHINIKHTTFKKHLVSLIKIKKKIIKKKKKLPTPSPLKTHKISLSHGSSHFAFNYLSNV